MSEVEKSEIFRKLASRDHPVVIELGCGPYKKDTTYIGIDLLDLPGVDIVHNLEEGLAFIPDASVDVVTSSHVLEHLVQFDQMMQEIHRILKKDGVHKVVVPHWSNPHYYSDYTHKRFFGLYTFDYFTPKTQQVLNRKVPDFYTSFHFIVTERTLRFKANPSPRNLLNLLVAKPLFNASNYMKELYEDKFTSLFFCRELYFEMKPIK